VGADLVEDIERCYAQGWTDGLPVVPPYASLVAAMCEAMGWEPAACVGRLEQLDVEVRAEQLAAAAVMAGCKTDYARVLRALSEALFDPRFNLSGVAVTTGGVGVLAIVSGPIVEELGFHHGSNAFGCAARPNATVGRFANLVMRLCGSAGGLLEEFGTIGHPGRLSYLVAEHPRTAWGPYHTQHAVDSAESAVTIVSAEGPNSVNNHYGETGAKILETIADCIRHYGSTNFFYRRGGYVVMIAPEHMSLVSAEFSRAEARDYLYRHAVRETDELVRIGRIPQHPSRPEGVEPGKPRSPVSAPELITFVESGGESGKFSAVVPCWVSNRAVVRVIESESRPR
jgi:hypothetical protein